MKEENCGHELRGKDRGEKYYTCVYCGKVIGKTETTQQNLEQVNSE